MRHPQAIRRRPRRTLGAQYRPAKRKLQALISTPFCRPTAGRETPRTRSAEDPGQPARKRRGTQDRTAAAPRHRTRRTMARTGRPPPAPSLPLDRAGRLRRHVVQHPVAARNPIDDRRGHRRRQLRRKPADARRSDASSARSRPWSTSTQVSRSPTASCTSRAVTALSTPPDSPQITRPRPTCARMRATASDRIRPAVQVPARPAASRTNRRGSREPSGVCTTSG